MLVAIGRERAARLLAHFEPEEVAQLRAIGQQGAEASRKLPNVSAAELTEIADSFEQTFERGPGVVGASSSFEEIMAETVLPEPAEEKPVERIAPPPPPDAADRKRRWAAIAEAPEGELATWLTEENEAVAALVVARLPPQLSAALLTQLSAEACSAIVGALPHADATPEAEDLVLDLLEAELADSAGGGADEKQSLLADIVNELEPDIGERVTKRLADTLTPQQMTAVSSRIFRFEDVARLNAAGRSALLGELPADRIVLALDGAAGELREAVLSALGQRMRRMVESELEAGIPARPDAVRGARRDIASAAIRLAGDGALELPQAA